MAGLQGGWASAGQGQQLLGYPGIWALLGHRGGGRQAAPASSPPAEGSLGALLVHPAVVGGGTPLARVRSDQPLGRRERGPAPPGPAHPHREGTSLASSRGLWPLGGEVEWTWRARACGPLATCPWGPAAPPPTPTAPPGAPESPARQHPRTLCHSSWLPSHLPRLPEQPVPCSASCVSGPLLPWQRGLCRPPSSRGWRQNGTPMGS